MQNVMMNSVARIGSAFAFAALAGCSTISTPTHNEDNCMVGETTKGTIIGLPFNRSAGEEYSTACSQGRAAAAITYVGRNDQGKLNPKSALFALQFKKDIQEKVKAGDESGDSQTSKFYTQVGHFFEFYLKKIGGMTIENIQEYVDELKAEAIKRRTPMPAPAPFVPSCNTMSGVIRSCPSKPQTAAPSSAASAPKPE